MTYTLIIGGSSWRLNRRGGTIVEKKYQVYIGGSSWANGPVLQADTITEGRRMAEEYGNTADWASIRRGETEVALHRRDTADGGMRWYKATL